jgi:hypothetical protein
MLGVSNLVQLELASSGSGLLHRMVYDYYASGADCEVTARDNRASYERYKLLPRMLRDVSHVDTSVTLFGSLLSPLHVFFIYRELIMIETTRNGYEHVFCDAGIRSKQTTPLIH